MTRVSIAMATYNGEKYIGEQLASFARQSRLPDELIVSDDASTDNTLDRVIKFARTSPFEVRILTNTDNIGFYRNFGCALEAATGDIIFLSDQDDSWMEDKIATHLKVFAESPDTLYCITDMALCDQNLLESGYTQLGNIRSSGGKIADYSFGCAVSLRSTLLRIVLPLPESPMPMAHDNWTNHISLALDCRVTLEEVMQRYRRHGATVSNSASSRPQAFSFIDNYALHGLRSSLSGWEAEILRWIMTLERLEERKGQIAATLSEPKWTSAVSRVSSEIQALRRRCNIVIQPRAWRWLAVGTFFAEGGYSRFRGWKSAIKDIIRP